jgi:NAD(P)-dependent dehydrogenase (short-subunit alcohol dehydrogenase family)
MSKLANLLFTYELQRRLEAQGDDTHALACHPGGSDTELARHIPRWLMLTTRPVMRFFTQPPPEGALPTLRAAVDPDARGGEYYGPAGRAEMAGPPVLVKSTAASHDRESARRLWDLSIELTGVDPGI